ncbi:HK97 family phage prohead protease [uncultured Sphingomonas sp.]|uniref:HK97 family phage prohead protease n=1 Tax=uncultured Sphingomonas sp. TaxID=158754 RepID=UPI0025F5D98C|nr:HK97 family phage prohead protease [uncultured Sphingomonas sp.]
MKIEKKTFVGSVEVKLADPNSDVTSKSFTGYGAYFGNEDSYGDVIAPGAFTKSLARHEAAGTLPLMLLNHDAWNQLPVGVWKSMSEDDSGLVVEGELLDTSIGADVYKALKAGAITGLSIGFRCLGFEMTGEKRTITEADLMEVSVVTFPANDLARVESVKAENQENEMEDDEAIKAALTKAGFDDDAVEALFNSRKSEDDEEVVSEEASSDDEDQDETKYNQAEVLAAIEMLVKTTKEMYVR